MATKSDAVKKRAGRIIAGLLAALVLFCFTSPGRQALAALSNASGFGGRPGTALSIHVLDVGKADAILIRCDGHNALLDAGTAIHGDTVVDYLSRNQLGGLDYAIVSHPDSDHIGGMAQVLQEVDCGLFVRSRYFSDGYEQVDHVLRGRSIPQRVVAAGDSLPLGGARLTVLGPVREYEDPNNASLVIKLEFPGFSALFCGDAEQDAEFDLIDSGADLSADLLKVGHHGSATSTSYAILKAVDPEWAVISVGPDANNLPKETVLRRLESVCKEVYRTDVSGTVVLCYDGKQLSTRTER